MNFQGLKRASRQCLLDSGIQPRRLTLLFLLCFYALSIPCDCLTYVLEYQINRLSGLSAATLRNRYYLWTSTITVVIMQARSRNIGFVHIAVHRWERDMSFAAGAARSSPET